ncbi:uncharacterized protein PRCAT00003339001 [Priceomyces carsonii]|uniref:uncharacterized protein n=1 Tax=Priceomyces carsonii TaxID=28549 RepID=UPI002EDAD22C|nr:unnamed protein product [Priceomyces carsonii]
MTSDYYDIDDILADSEKIPCRFNMTIPGLGYLEGNPGKLLAKDTKIEIPMWLAEVLAVSGVLEQSEMSFVDLSEPDFVNSRVTNAIKTSPVSVDLHSIMPNYYKLAEKWCALFEDRSTIQIIMEMLRERAFEIYNFANNANKQVNNDFVYSLDEFERKLLRVTSDTNRQMRKWIQE